LDYGESAQRGRNDLTQIAEAAAKVLLIRDVLIHRRDCFEARGLGSDKQLSVLEAIEPCVPGGLTLVISEEMPQAFINALVN
jgi:hypothetical protein